jgi:hypothetical protein
MVPVFGRVNTRPCLSIKLLTCWRCPHQAARELRDDRPFGGAAPPAAMLYYSRDRTGEHPQIHLANYAGIFQAEPDTPGCTNPIASMAAF